MTKKLKFKYPDPSILKKIPNFIKLFFYDLKNKNMSFNEYGLTLFCGRQGAGKTMAMTYYLEAMRQKYPDVHILTNYFYKNQTKSLDSVDDIMSYRNGDNGVIFAIDEIQNEFSSTAWKDFPEFLLSEITQQRKQKVKIVGTSQVFTRVVKQLREQTYEVVECNTLFGRWTFTKCFDAEEYNLIVDNPILKQKLRRLYRHNFIQTDNIRDLYDSYAKIESIKSKKYDVNKYNI